MWASGPSEKELEALGLRREDLQDDSNCEVWADNWDAFKVFELCSYQWRMSNGYRVGLDYNVVKWALELHKVKKNRHLDLLNEVRVMENAALLQMQKDDSERNRKK